MSKFRGLPQEKKMRHERHFVEEITAERSESLGRMIDIDRVVPNPHQPRKHFGDLSEMVASVKEKGILEPILVRYDEATQTYPIIAGERRYQSAKLAGLTKVPCIEVDVDSRGMLEISLVENLQRKDLTPFEEAGALKRLVEQFRYTHDEIARKLGKSRTAITETLSLTRLPDDVAERCRQADISSKSLILQIVRQESAGDMHRMVDRIIAEGLTRDEARRVHRTNTQRRRPRSYIFRYKPEHRSFQLSLRFQKAEVERREVIEALHELLANLERDDEIERFSARKLRSGGRNAQAEA